MEPGLSATQRMGEFSKMIMRKFRSIKYTHVMLTPEYLEAEKQYKRVRECLGVLDSSVIKNLSNYEHGSKMFKSLKKGMQFINDKASLGMYKNQDMFEEAAALGEDTMKINSDTKYQIIGKKYAEAYGAVAKSKHALNTRLAQIRARIKEVKNEIQEIDGMRKKTQNTRYDLEMALQERKGNSEAKDVQKKEFDVLEKNVRKMMQKFIDGNEIPRIMKDASIEYKRHLEEASDALKFIG